MVILVEILYGISDRAITRPDGAERVVCDSSNAILPVVSLELVSKQL